MSDVEPTPAPRAATAGGLLRQARQTQGLHIGALAAAIKVTQRKLELLESDQLDQLPDATFTRALAQTVCRTLKVDAAPILALLPPIASHRLEHVAEGLNTPFADRPGRMVPKEWAKVASPAVWLAVLLVIAAIVVYAMPSGWLPVPRPAQTRLPAAPASSPALPIDAASTVAAPGLVSSATPVASLAMTEPMPSTASTLAAEAGTSPVEAASTSVLQVHATAQSWVEIADARGKALLARVVQPGESIAIDGDLPMKLKIGNSGVTQLTFRGERVDLAPFTRDNMARLELK